LGVTISNAETFPVVVASIYNDNTSCGTTAMTVKVYQGTCKSGVVFATGPASCGTTSNITNGSLIACGTGSHNYYATATVAAGGTEGDCSGVKAYAPPACSATPAAPSIGNIIRK